MAILPADHCVTVIQNETLNCRIINTKDLKLRKRLLAKISRKDYTLTASHRICSAHFAGGKKAYLNNVPRIIPKTVNLIKRTLRKRFKQYSSFKEVVAKSDESNDLTKSFETETELTLT